MARQDEERRSQERIRDASSRRLAREDPATREEQQRNTAARRLAREDPATRREEQQQNTAAHQESRADPRYRAQEQQEQANTTRRQQVCASTPVVDPGWGIWGKCPPPPLQDRDTLIEQSITLIKQSQCS